MPSVFKEQQEGQCGWSKESKGIRMRRENGRRKQRSKLCRALDTVIRMLALLPGEIEPVSDLKQKNDMI